MKPTAPRAHNVLSLLGRKYANTELRWKNTMYVFVTLGLLDPLSPKKGLGLPVPVFQEQTFTSQKMKMTS